jgi:Family of unknown function (DUF5947)
MCACGFCSLLLHNVERYKPVESKIRRLGDFRIGDADWQALQIPVSLAFFYRTDDGNVIAVYPSPAGPVRSKLDASHWGNLARVHAKLGSLAPFVEAILIDRSNAARCFLTPIDKCYQLIGTIRRYWHGFSGGAEVRQKVADFFDDLERQADAAAAEGLIMPSSG